MLYFTIVVLSIAASWKSLVNVTVFAVHEIDQFNTRLYYPRAVTCNYSFFFLRGQQMNNHWSVLKTSRLRKTWLHSVQRRRVHFQRVRQRRSWARTQTSHQSRSKWRCVNTHIFKSSSCLEEKSHREDQQQTLNSSYLGWQMLSTWNNTLVINYLLSLQLKTISWSYMFSTA